MTGWVKLHRTFNVLSLLYLFLAILKPWNSSSYLMLIFLGGITIKLLLFSFSLDAIDEITSGGFITNESSSLMTPSIGTMGH